MAITSAEELGQRALDLDLLDERQLQQIMGEFGSREVALEDLRRVLLSRDLLTFYQIEHLIAGNRTSFHYGDFKVLYLVGTGTFARVYRATNRRNGQLAAVKVLRKRFAEIKEEAERFFREGKMGMPLQHPNIVPIYDVGTQDRIPYIIIEFIEGQNLREFSKIRKIFEPLESSRLMLDVCNGLQYAFERGIFHRDLKMSNVLVSSRGQAKLVDFGLAGGDKDKKVSDDMLMKNPNPRAIDYAGLERATGVHKNDPRSDIFFVGCMYYHMVTGHSAMVTTNDRTQRLSKGRFQDIRPAAQLNPSIPYDVVAIIQKAISFDPDRRYQSPGEMAEDLKAVLAQDRAVPNPSIPGAGAVDTDENTAHLEGFDANGQQRIVVVVEGDMAMQDMFRDKLKKNGYRVLVITDPQRAMARIADDSQPVHAVIVSTGAIGESGLELFNKLGHNERTKKLPAILLLGAKQRSWQSGAETDRHRPVAIMPITLRQLRETLLQLFEATDQAPAK